MKFTELTLNEIADETDDARAARTNASEPETSTDEPVEVPTGAVQNTNIRTQQLPTENGVPFANQMLRGLFGAIVTTLFSTVAQQNPAIGNILRVILSGQSGGFNPNMILGMVPGGARPQVQRLISQFDPRTGQPTDVPLQRGRSSGRINYENHSSSRNLALSDRLESVLRRTAEEVGLDVHITSGGQRAYNTMPEGTRQNTNGRIDRNRPSNHWITPTGETWRVGSRRHDNGNAADLYLTDSGQRIRLDDPRMNAFVEAFFRNGGQGGSGDHDYMGPFTIHLDVVGTAAGGSVFWNATNQFMAAANRGLAAQGRA